MDAIKISISFSVKEFDNIQISQIKSNFMLIFNQEKASIDIKIGSKTSITIESVEMDKQIQDEEIKVLMKDYYQQLESMGLEISPFSCIQKIFYFSKTKFKEK